MSYSELSRVRRNLEEVALTWLPRLLTQIDRDPTSSTYGCADRDWWHYKIRDFPSIILQQAGYTAWLAASLPAFRDQAKGLRRLAVASAAFWARRAQRWGAFEEYYPNEQGFPPLAFSTLVVIKLVAQGALPPEDIRGSVERAARELTTRFESEASNQQVAALAALAWTRRIYPDLVPAEELEGLIRETLALQTEEGWYREYGGPDLGYLSVTIDCLWDAYDASGDERFLKSAVAALGFIEAMAAFGGAKTGMLFSRNTDYILPYGIARFCRYRGALGERAARLITLLYADADRPDHFLRAIDDRYVSHYAGHSLLRAIAKLAKGATRRADLPPALAPASTKCTGTERYFLRSGHFLRMPEHGPWIAIALHKGGVATIRAPDGSFASDYGWFLPMKGGRAVSHWWSDHWRAERLENGWRIRGPLVLCREQLSKPWKHAVVRLTSCLLGRHIKAALKRLMIVGKRQSAWSLDRTIQWEGERIVIKDLIAGLPPKFVPEPAPRASRRYVPSANSLHHEDFQLAGGSWQVERRTARESEGWRAETIYSYSLLRAR